MLGPRDSFLVSASWLYGGGALLHQWLVWRGLLKQGTLPAPVISVGNLTVGGTGKTPMVCWLAKRLLEQGKKPVVLTRGYRRRSRGVLIVSRGAGSLVSTRVGGDEPVLIATKVNVPVVVGAKRLHAGQVAEREFHPDCFLLDDGFQHYRLARELDIVLIRSGSLGQQRPIPAGHLREPARGLSRAGIVVITCWHDETQVEATRREIAALGFTGPIYSARFRVGPARLVSGRSLPSGSGVFLFAGIASPDRFLTCAQSAGLAVQGHLWFSDHWQFTSFDIRGVEQRALDSGASYLLTTEKDAVRLMPQMTYRLPLAVLPGELDLAEDGARLLEDVLTALRGWN